MKGQKIGCNNCMKSLKISDNTILNLNTNKLLVKPILYKGFVLSDLY